MASSYVEWLIVILDNRLVSWYIVGMNQPGKNLIRNVVLEFMAANELKRSRFWQLYASDIILDHSHFYKWLRGETTISDEKAGRLLYKIGKKVVGKEDFQNHKPL